jgi:hypothetical protein
MRPKERRELGEQDLFRSRLDQIIDLDHALVKLAKAIDWRFLEEKFGAVYSDKPGSPPLPTRLMAGLSILKHSYDLRNHAPQTAAMDLFVVPTIGLIQLYVLVIVRLGRRELACVNVTRHPTAEWIAQQITEAFPWNEAPRYLVRDQDGIYGAVVTRRLRAMRRPNGCSKMRIRTGGASPSWSCSKPKPRTGTAVSALA